MSSDPRGEAKRETLIATTATNARAPKILHADLATRPGGDIAPSCGLRDRLARGAVPAIVLERYLAP